MMSNEECSDFAWAAEFNFGKQGCREIRHPFTTLNRRISIGFSDGGAAVLFYCAVEQTAGLWAASYLNLYKGIPAENAAGFASMFFLGITIGRAFSGLIAMKLNDAQMVRLGLGMIAVGILAVLLPVSSWSAIAGLIVIGLGCAPIYPAMIHSTPARFGAKQSQAIVGVQMASAYTGTCIMPPIFGILAERISVALLPLYLLGGFILMVVMFHLLNRKAVNAS